MVETQKPVRLAHAVAVFAGNGLEFYNFLSYALFSVYIGKAFFPAHDPSISTLLSLATFGIGFITRPVGAIVLGTLGDRIGRKPSLLISFAMMGIGMLGLALTPTYAQIGIAAPLIVLLCRLMQGFALGGEVGTSTAYMIEAAPPDRRGGYGSMQNATQYASTLVASLVAVGLSFFLTGAQMSAFGWRLVFLLGVLIVPFGLYARRNLPETLHAADDAALAPDATLGKLTVAQMARPYLRVIVLGLLLLICGTIGSYVITYLTTYSIDTLHFPARFSFGITTVTSLFGVALSPVSGLLSDRFGRRPVILVGYAATFLSVLPVFWAVNHYQTVPVFYAGMSWLSILFVTGQTPVVITLTESLPPRIRAGAVATIYAFAISIFGGTTQVVLKALIDYTHNPMAPAYYWLAACALGVGAAIMMREFAPAKIAAVPGAASAIA